MFQTDTLTNGSNSKRLWGTFAGVTGQALLVTCAAIAPMVSPAMLPRAAWITTIAAPGTPPPPPPLGPSIRPRTSQATRIFHGPILSAPLFIPAKAQIIVDPGPEVPAGPGVQGGMDGGREGGVRVGSFIDRILSDVKSPAPVVRPPEPVTNTARPAAVAVNPPRISALELGHPIRRVEPLYPQLARQARVSGVVELQGVLGTDGRIHELRVLRGHPLLIKAAVDAVSQWTWAPTILNGEAVEVVAPITVTFRLNQ